MKPYFLNSDINVLCVAASSFPDGIMAAFEKLNSLIQSPEPRRVFGISYGDGNKKITYKAAAEENSADEAARLGCERFTIKKGEYISQYIVDFMKNIPAIGQTFQEMCRDQRIDSNGYCIEMYLNNNKDVFCMVKLDPAKM
jgi:predicted transcriptional regulator YdeE